MKGHAEQGHHSLLHTSTEGKWETNGNDSILVHHAQEQSFQHIWALQGRVCVLAWSPDLDGIGNLIIWISHLKRKKLRLFTPQDSNEWHCWSSWGPFQHKPSYDTMIQAQNIKNYPECEKMTGIIKGKNQNTKTWNRKSKDHTASPLICPL